MIENWDTFEPFQGVKKQNFKFQPSRFEMWIGGEMVKSGRTIDTLTASVIEIDGNERVEITFNDKSLHSELAPSNIFDEFITARDRLQLIIVPQQTNVQNMGIMGFQNILGHTRKIKNFNRNEPYCCNLFLSNGGIAKITFSYSNPEKLIEFYS